ncbi:MAG: hypothetical protein KR126chlam2_00490 [Chlamydiae bacterium]|nr:hypothetical protein [Chlamydiota bacterium]
MRSNRNRSNVTLIELLIVIALIGLTLGGLTIPKALRKETFEKGVQRICSKIGFANELMIDYSMDVALTLEQKESGLHCEIIPKSPMPEKMLRLINKDIKIAGVKKISLDGRADSKITLHFTGSSGRVTSGKLTLVGAREVTLVLPGYPCRITTKREEASHYEAPYPQEVHSAA